MPIDKLEEDRFYEYIPTGQILCGGCAAAELKKSEDGTYSEEEKMYVQDFDPVDDYMEPYQCENCNKQNEAYDNLEVEDA